MQLKKPVGQVIGTDDAFALDFWVDVEKETYLQLDDVVSVPLRLPDGREITIHGVVDRVRSRLEGARFASDAKRARDQLMAFNVSNAAHVAVTRVEPEIFVAPFPGSDVGKSEGAQRDEALIVPREAVYEEGGKSVVYVKQAENFAAREVALGVASGTQVAVLSGLEAGEEIALQPVPVYN